MNKTAIIYLQSAVLEIVENSMETIMNLGRFRRHFHGAEGDTYSGAIFEQQSHHFGEPTYIFHVIVINTAIV